MPERRNRHTPAGGSTSATPVRPDEARGNDAQAPDRNDQQRSAEIRRAVEQDPLTPENTRPLPADDSSTRKELEENQERSATDAPPPSSGEDEGKTA